jgi:ornithine cyclodeaminase/alanine dehydrogenase-like protein (mu-crystallin family)
MRLLDGGDVDALATGELGFAAARESARLAASGRVTTGRVQTGTDGAWMRVLVGLIPELDLVGYKEFHRVGKRVRYHVSLFRHSDGDALGIVDGRRITSLRTASTAALAFHHTFGGAAIRLGVIGSGEEAREGLRAVAGVADLSEVRVYSPSVANRTSFAERMAAALDVPVAPADGVKAALAGVDAAYVATAARSPVVVADDVRKLRLVAAVGATRPDHHELAADVIAEAGVVVVDCPDALIEPGDMIDAGRDGWSPEEALLLGDWLARPFVSTDDRPVLFKSIGSIEQDLVLCRQLLAAADERDLGREVAEVGTLRVMR